MNYSLAVQSLDKKFSSGNDVPVSQTTITREEWEALREGPREETDSEITAHVAGVSAAYYGRPISSCPYAEGDALRDFWISGFKIVKGDE